MFCAAQLLVNVSLNDVKFVQYKNIMSEHLLGTELRTCKYVFELPSVKINLAKITVFTP